MKTVLCGDREDGSSSTKLISDHPVRGREEANNNHTACRTQNIVVLYNITD
jgi:hypothetical protein